MCQQWWTRSLFSWECHKFTIFCTCWQWSHFRSFLVRNTLFVVQGRSIFEKSGFHKTGANHRTGLHIYVSCSPSTLEFRIQFIPIIFHFSYWTSEGWFNYYRSHPIRQPTNQLDQIPHTVFQLGPSCFCWDCPWLYLPVRCVWCVTRLFYLNRCYTVRV